MLGYAPHMTDPHLEDHLVGLELQLVEQVEQRERAKVQQRPEDAARIEEEIEELTLEMAETAEKVAKADGEIPVIDAPEAGAATPR